MWPYFLGAGLAAAIVALTRKAKASTGIGDMTLPPDPFENAIVVTDQGGTAWLVSPSYFGPVGIGEAAALAKAAGGELPTAGLVDAIWRAADLKLLPMPRQNVVSQAVFDDQIAKIQNQIGGRPFRLMGGAFKDIIQMGGHPQLYGWHVEDEQAADFSKRTGVPLHAPITAGPGRIIQGPSGSVHSLGFKDYSQGLRFVKRV